MEKREKKNLRELKSVDEKKINLKNVINSSLF